MALAEIRFSFDVLWIRLAFDVSAATGLNIVGFQV